jgi:hypothetical protein
MINGILMLEHRLIPADQVTSFDLNNPIAAEEPSAEDDLPF